MNVSESCDVNTLLRWMLGLEAPSEDKAKQAAANLAKRSYQRLAAGLTPDQVLERWPGRITANAAAAAEIVLERDNAEVVTAPPVPVRGKQARFRRAGATRLRPLGEME